MISTRHPVRRRIVGLLAVAGICAPGMSAADERHWTNPDGGSFHAHANWSPAVAPDSFDVAVFDLDAAYEVSFASDVTNRQLIVRDGQVVLRLFADQDQWYTLTEPRSVIVGDEAGKLPELTITGGTLYGNRSVIGDLPGSIGEMHLTAVDGLPDPIWTNTGELTIGNLGSGALHVTAGSISSMAGRLGFAGAGHASISGSGSSWTASGLMLIGDGGQGTLEIADGGYLQSNFSHIGYLGGASGAVNVTGADSLWQAGSWLEVGTGGQASLEVTAGGRVNSQDGYIGYEGGSSGAAVIDGPGSSWEITGSLWIGGREDGSAGAGTMTISNGGVVTAGQNVHVWNDAALYLRDGSVMARFVEVEGTLSGRGMIDGDLTLHPSGTLRIDLADTTDFDRIEVTGLLALDGTLEVRLMDAYQPQGGDSFEILGWGTLSGTLQTLDLPELAGGLSWNAGQLYTSGLLSVIGGLLPGDANFDGRVDGEDFLIWQAAFGTQAGATWGDGDFNGDGRVDGEDFLIWQANFGRVGGSTGLTPGATVTPEAGAMGLLLAMGWLLGRRGVGAEGHGWL